MREKEEDKHLSLGLIHTPLPCTSLLVEVLQYIMLYAILNCLVVDQIGNPITIFNGNNDSVANYPRTLLLDIIGILF